MARSGKLSIATSIASDTGKFKRHLRKRITKDEVKRRMGYILLGIFAANFIEPVQNLLMKLNINPLFISAVGLFLVFYYFDF